MNDTIKYISDVIEKISGIKNIDKDINLLGPESKVASYLFIYGFYNREYCLRVRQNRNYLMIFTFYM